MKYCPTCGWNEDRQSCTEAVFFIEGFMRAKGHRLSDVQLVWLERHLRDRAGDGRIKMDAARDFLETALSKAHNELAEIAELHGGECEDSE